MDVSCANSLPGTWDWESADSALRGIYSLLRPEGGVPFAPPMTPSQGLPSSTFTTRKGMLTLLLSQPSLGMACIILIPRWKNGQGSAGIATMQTLQAPSPWYLNPSQPSAVSLAYNPAPLTVTSDGGRQASRASYTPCFSRGGNPSTERSEGCQSSQEQERVESLFRAASHQGSGRWILCNLLYTHFLTLILMTAPILQMWKLRLQTSRLAVVRGLSI